jgi:hypothetical protein
VVVVVPSGLVVTGAVVAESVVVLVVEVGGVAWW